VLYSRRHGSCALQQTSRPMCSTADVTAHVLYSRRHGPCALQQTMTRLMCSTADVTAHVPHSTQSSPTKLVSGQNESTYQHTPFLYCKAHLHTPPLYTFSHTHLPILSELICFNAENQAPQRQSQARMNPHTNETGGAGVDILNVDTHSALFQFRTHFWVRFVPIEYRE